MAARFFARRFARKHPVPEALGAFVLPLLPVLREDQDPAVPLELTVDLTGAQQREKEVRVSQPYKKGAYPQVVDTVYADPWISGHAVFVDGVDLRFAVTDHVRASNKTKKSASGKTKRKTKVKRKSEVAVTVSLPTRNYAAAGDVSSARDVPKESIKASEQPHGRQAQRRRPGRARHQPAARAVSAAYERVDPARRKKL